MRSFIGIWRFLVRNKFNEPFYTRELVNEAGIDPRIAHTWIKDNTKNGTIRSDVKAGRTKFYRLNLDILLTRKIVELVLAAESEGVQKDNEFLAAVVQETKESNMALGKEKILLVVLYGSHARKMASKASDVDLFFVIEDEDKGAGKRKVRELCEMISDRYSRKIEPVIVKEKQFANMLKVPEDFIRNVMRDGVPLYGLEYYVIYRSSAKVI